MAKRHEIELSGQTLAALTALGQGPSTPVCDASFDLAGLVEAAGGSDALLMRAHCALEAASESRFAAQPDDGVWLLLTDAQTAPCWCGWRCDKAETGAAQELALELVEEPCCDRKKCQRKKYAARLWLGVAGARFLLAERLEHSEAEARSALQPLQSKLQLRLFEDAGAAAPAAAQDKGTVQGSFEPLAVARWSLRREGGLHILRDHAGRGPRESAQAHGLATVALALLTAMSGLATWRAYGRQSWGDAGVWAALAVVLVLATFAWFNIARWAWLYRASSEVLLSASRDRFVLQPWCSRSGEVDVKPEGRFGAGLEIRAFEGWRVEQQAQLWALICDTDHGAYPVASFATQAMAEGLSRALQEVFDQVCHAPLVAKAMQNSEALGAEAGPTEP